MERSFHRSRARLWSLVKGGVLQAGNAAERLRESVGLLADLLGGLPGA